MPRTLKMREKNIDLSNRILEAFDNVPFPEFNKLLEQLAFERAKLGDDEPVIFAKKIYGRDIPLDSDGLYKFEEVYSFLSPEAMHYYWPRMVAIVLRGDVEADNNFVGITLHFAFSVKHLKSLSLSDDYEKLKMVINFMSPHQKKYLAEGVQEIMRILPEFNFEFDEFVKMLSSDSVE